MGCVIAEAVIYRLLTMGTRVQSQDIPCGICDGQNAAATGYSGVLQLFLTIIIAPALYTITEAGVVDPFEDVIARDGPT
jgi:hypothetical protein